MGVGFLDRQPELARLRTAWERAVAGQPQLVVVWGRRRVGKTYLLSHFTADKRTVFHGSTAQAAAIELGRLGESVARGLGAGTLDAAGGRFASWEAALRFFAARAREQPLAVVLDEVPYLARSTPGFTSVVQAVWDHLAAPNHLFLVLNGSATGVMERMLGAGGSLRGRPTESIRVDPLDPWSARLFLPSLPASDFVEAYAACGGYPLHLRAWDQSLDVHGNLLRLAGSPGGLLLEDAAGILREELPESGGYTRILAAVGRGRHRYGAIASEAGQRIEHALEVLVAAGFVRRAAPVGAPAAAKPLYDIADPYLSFWFETLYADITQIDAGQGRQVLERARPRWARHVGAVFQEVARLHARRQVAAGSLPNDLVIGRWWAATGEPAEIDVLGLRGSRTQLVGEARWQARPIGLRDLRELESRARRAPKPASDLIHSFWSRAGAEPEVLRTGARGYSIDQIIDGS